MSYPADPETSPHFQDPAAGGTGVPSTCASGPPHRAGRPGFIRGGADAACLPLVDRGATARAGAADRAAPISISGG
jgi:hypothetical protein